MHRQLESEQYRKQSAVESSNYQPTRVSGQVAAVLLCVIYTIHIEVHREYKLLRIGTSVDKRKKYMLHVKTQPYILPSFRKYHRENTRRIAENFPFTIGVADESRTLKSEQYHETPAVIKFRFIGLAEAQD